MDKLIYTAMSGSKYVLDQQATNSHNLANASTTGFKAQIDSFRAVPVVGEGLSTRSYAVNTTSGTDFTPGAIQHTGRSLDVAVEGKGWLAVQTSSGAEAYTRNGSFKINENGVLQTATGLNVMGDGGPISIPPNVSISIAADGTISSVNDGQVPGPTNMIGRLKLTNPDERGMIRTEEGLFTNKDGRPAAADSNVRVVNGALESSNVNVVESMVNMISLARQFDVQMKLLQNATENDTKAAQLFNIN